MPAQEKQYGTKITAQGANCIAACILSGSKLNITQAAAGDGGGDYYMPSIDQTELRGERWRGPIVAAGPNPTVPNMLDVKIAIDDSTVNFVCREVGLFSEDGVLVAVCNTPDTEKTASSAGVDGRLTMVMHIVVADASALEFTIVPTLDAVNREDLDEALNGMKPLSGAGDPTGDTVGAVGQRYVNTESGAIFTCVSAENQDYVWKAEGAAETAKKLSTARTIHVNLGSASAASFDGSANVQPGVTGTLPVARGGTGATSAAAARTNLGACAKVAPVTVNVPLSWSGSGPWTQTITVSGVTAADEHLGIFPAPVSDAASRKLQYAAYACLSPGNCETQAGKIKLVCDDKKPTVAFQIILKGVR